jgi:hypothetical protein
MYGIDAGDQCTKCVESRQDTLFLSIVALHQPYGTFTAPVRQWESLKLGAPRLHYVHAAMGALLAGMWLRR